MSMKADGAYGIICSYYSCPASEGDDAFAMFIFQAFIIYEPDLFFKDCSKQFFIVCLLFDSMREYHVCLLRHQNVRGYFLDTYQEITV